MHLIEERSLAEVDHLPNLLLPRQLVVAVAVVVPVELWMAQYAMIPLGVESLGVARIAAVI